MMFDAHRLGKMEIVPKSISKHHLYLGICLGLCLDVDFFFRRSCIASEGANVSPNDGHAVNMHGHKPSDPITYNVG